VWESRDRDRARGRMLREQDFEASFLQRGLLLPFLPV
jgi:hypothetical protein